MTPVSCPACQAALPPGAAFCANCGSPSPTVVSSERSLTSAAPPLAEPTAARLARALGAKYQVKRLVGRGGFAEVYELWDVDLDRRLACKVLHPEIAWTPGMLARFRQEAKALARLQHPAILPIHFAGDGEGLVYYVMPFVEGESLADALRRRGVYTADEALAVAEPILQALAHAHSQGLVHRDIKPDNVMLEPKTGRALLVDFGIAKLLDPNAGGAKTATGFTVGTVQYMSPEQALGQADLDGRTDLYAFGAMLFQMVTGTPPYDGKSSAEIVGKHLADPIPVASDVDTKIPRWLSNVIVRCLAKKPEDRFQTADDVLKALKAGRTSGSTQLVGAASVQRQVRGSDGARRRVPWPVYAVAGVLVLGALGYGVRQGYFGGSVVWMHNALVEPVELLRDGVPFDTIAPEVTVRLRAARLDDLSWRLVRPGNPPIGELLDGALPSPHRVLGRRVIRITADANGQRFFAPLVTNTTATELTVEVNPGTAAAVRCQCVVPRGAVRTHVGYYRLFANSAVAAYNTAHPYLGDHVDQNGFADRVAPRSGAVILTY
ncbi:MAG TPA: serine/threonine-protein kinase [Gemmatimonadales bacterium]|nr:serine/threonine-protein kinase [Gemmatimonadales bacterium]